MDTLVDARALPEYDSELPGLAIGRAGPALSRRKTPEMPCLSACTPLFVAQSLEVAQSWWNTQVAFGEHRAHMSLHAAGHPATHEVQFPGTGVAVVTRLEAIGSDSDLVAEAT